MGLVGQNQQTTFANPQNGQAPDADVIRGNDNATVAKHNAHDADATIHVQTGLLSARPAAGTAYAMYLDENRRLYVDNGSTWTEVPYAPTANPTFTGTVNGTTASFSGTITAGTFSGSGASLTGVPATALSGSSLPAGITGSSLTTVGTLTGLTMAGGGTANFQDGIVQSPRLQSYGEVRTTPTVSGGTLTLNLNNGNVFNVSMGSSVSTLTIQNPKASGIVSSFTLSLAYTANGLTVTWPGSVRWPNAIAPTLTGVSGKTDIFTFSTWDGGTTWFGFVAGLNY